MAIPEISYALDPSREEGLAGCIDAVDESGIRGWVIDVARKNRSLPVTAYFGDVPVGKGMTCLARPDVGGRYEAPAYCGFHIHWERSHVPAIDPETAGADAQDLVVVVAAEEGLLRWAGPVSAAALRAWIESGDAVNARYFAGVEEIGAIRVTGFTRDRHSTAPASIEILADDAVVATVVCDLRREGVMPGEEDRDCGFEWRVPASFRDGRRRRLAVRILGTATELPGSGIVVEFAPPAGPSAPFGIFVAPGPVWITGWVADDREADPLAIELHLDGKPVARGLAGQYGPDLEGNQAYPFKSVHTRFSFAMPAQLLDGWEHEVRIVVPGWGAQQLPDATVRWRSADHFGRLEACSGNRVAGWVALPSDADDAARRVPVQIQVDGKLQTHCFLGPVRADVTEAGVGFTAYGFSAAMSGVRGESISASYRDVELRGSRPQAGRAARIKGNVDVITRNTLSGWAVDLERPQEPVELGVYIDGRLSTRFITSQPRADVAGAVALPVTRVGFTEPTPAELKDGAPHLVEIRALSNGALLPSEVQVVQFRSNYTELPSTDRHRVLSEFIARATHAPVRSAGTPLVSIIILNRNGAQILDALFRSFCAVNSLAAYEFIVVDHASSDASLDILAQWSSRGVPLLVLPLPYNGSFSASNNLAVRDHARGRYVLLLNNDIVFVQDVLPAMIDTLERDPRIGVVGVKLLDVVEDQGSNLYPPIQHMGIRYGLFGRNGVLPYDEKLSMDSASEAFRPIHPAGVTGAVMLMRRDEYLATGGLEEAYFYGYEDVDLCLKYRVLNGQEIVCRNDLQVLHHRGYSRLSGREQKVFEQLDTNKVVLMKRWGHALNQFYRASLLRGDRIYTAERLRIAFAVTEDGPDAIAGDYFTALELARAITAAGYAEPVFLSERADWYDLERINVLIVMRHDYDLRSICNARRDLVRIAWIRNHFEAWTAQHWFGRFDLYLSASNRFVGELARRGFRGEWFPIAANPEAMSAGTASADLTAVVGFNGSSWSVERRVESILEELAASVPVVVIGRGWQDSRIAHLHRGILPYDRMADFYASVTVVVDDANASARAWGAANSRVFDSLAAGRLVISNSAAASEELFAGLLPVWHTPEEAVATTQRYLTADAERIALVDRLRSMVLAAHTYSHRASRLWELLQESAASRLRIAIKCPAPAKAEVAWWGDWHLATGLRRALKRMGHSVRIDLLNEWSNPNPCDDAVIVLRGLSAYAPDPRHINILWILSHPDSVSIEECTAYDQVFSASSRHCAHLRTLGIDAQVLLQCADTDLMQPKTPDPSRAHQCLMVANSRGARRRIVADMQEIGRPLAIFGRGWHGLVRDDLIRGELVPHADLPAYYSSAGVVLNDHWPDMARWGFISNRIFDAAACGAYIVSDVVEGLDEVFGDQVKSYRTLAELSALTGDAACAAWSRAQADELRRTVMAGHTYAHRAQKLCARIRAISEAKQAGSHLRVAAEIP
jgi:GT2 family glycosyltransferase/spore maturation protein CgeB